MANDLLSIFIQRENTHGISELKEKLMDKENKTELLKNTISFMNAFIKQGGAKPNESNVYREVSNYIKTYNPQCDDNEIEKECHLLKQLLQIVNYAFLSKEVKIAAPFSLYMLPALQYKYKTLIERLNKINEFSLDILEKVNLISLGEMICKKTDKDGDIREFSLFINAFSNKKEKSEQEYQVCCSVIIKILQYNLKSKNEYGRYANLLDIIANEKEPIIPHDLLSKENFFLNYTSFEPTNIPPSIVALNAKKNHVELHYGGFDSDFYLDYFKDSYSKENYTYLENLNNNIKENNEKFNTVIRAAQSISLSCLTTNQVTVLENGIKRIILGNIYPKLNKDAFYPKDWWKMILSSGEMLREILESKDSFSQLSEYQSHLLANLRCIYINDELVKQNKIQKNILAIENTIKQYSSETTEITAVTKNRLRKIDVEATQAIFSLFEKGISQMPDFMQLAIKKNIPLELVSYILDRPSLGLKEDLLTAHKNYLKHHGIKVRLNQLEEDVNSIEFDVEKYYSKDRTPKVIDSLLNLLLNFKGKFLETYDLISHINDYNEFKKIATHFYDTVYQRFENNHDIKYNKAEPFDKNASPYTQIINLICEVEQERSACLDGRKIDDISYNGMFMRAIDFFNFCKNHLDQIIDSFEKSKAQYIKEYPQIETKLKQFIERYEMLMENMEEYWDQDNIADDLKRITQDNISYLKSKLSNLPRNYIERLLNFVPIDNDLLNSHYKELFNAQTLQKRVLNLSQKMNFRLDTQNQLEKIQTKESLWHIFALLEHEIIDITQFIPLVLKDDIPLEIVNHAFKKLLLKLDEDLSNWTQNIAKEENKLVSAIDLFYFYESERTQIIDLFEKLRQQDTEQSQKLEKELYKYIKSHKDKMEDMDDFWGQINIAEEINKIETKEKDILNLIDNKFPKTKERYHHHSYNTEQDRLWYDQKNINDAITQKRKEKGSLADISKKLYSLPQKQEQYISSLLERPLQEFRKIINEKINQLSRCYYFSEDIADIIDFFHHIKERTLDICNLVNLETEIQNLPALNELQNESYKRVCFALASSKTYEVKTGKLNASTLKDSYSNFFQDKTIQNNYCLKSFLFSKHFAVNHYSDGIPRENNMTHNLYDIKRYLKEQIKLDALTKKSINEIFKDGNYRFVFVHLIINYAKEMVISDELSLNEFSSYVEILASRFIPDNKTSKCLPNELLEEKFKSKMESLEKFIKLDQSDNFYTIILNTRQRLPGFKGYLDNNLEYFLNCMIKINQTKNITCRIFLYHLFINAIYLDEINIKFFIKELDTLEKEHHGFDLPLDILYEKSMMILTKSIKTITYLSSALKRKVVLVNHYLNELLSTHKYTEEELIDLLAHAHRYSDSHPFSLKLMACINYIEYTKCKVSFKDLSTDKESSSDEKLSIDKELFNILLDNNHFFSRLKKRAPHRFSDAIEFLKKYPSIAGKKAIQKIYLKREKDLDVDVQKLIEFFLNYKGKSIDLITHIFSISSSFPISRFINEILFCPEKLEVFEKKHDIINFFSKELLPGYPLGTILFYSIFNEAECKKLDSTIKLAKKLDTGQHYAAILRGRVKLNGDCHSLPGLQPLDLSRVDDVQDEMRYFALFRIGMTGGYFKSLEDKYQKYGRVGKKIQITQDTSEKKFYTLTPTVSTYTSHYLCALSSTCYQVSTGESSSSAVKRAIEVKEKFRVLKALDPTFNIKHAAGKGIWAKNNEEENERAHISPFGNKYYFGSGPKDPENIVYFLGHEFFIDELLNLIMSMWAPHETINTWFEEALRSSIANYAKKVFEGKMSASAALKKTLGNLIHYIENDNTPKSEKFINHSINELINFTFDGTIPSVIGRFNDSKKEVNRTVRELMLEQGGWRAYFDLATLLLNDEDKFNYFMGTFNNRPIHNPIDWSMVKSKYMPNKLPTDRNLSFAENVSLPLVFSNYNGKKSIIKPPPAQEMDTVVRKLQKLRVKDTRDEHEASSSYNETMIEHFLLEISHDSKNITDNTSKRNRKG